MESCEMCGAKTIKLTPVKIAGTVMSVCKNCEGFGVKEQSSSKVYHTFKRKLSSDVSFEVVENFSEEIKKGLDRKKINVHQLAKTLNIKESSASKYLTGKLKPDLNHTRQISSFLNITLLREGEESLNKENYLNVEEESFSNSLGDLLQRELNKKK